MLARAVIRLPKASSTCKCEKFVLFQSLWLAYRYQYPTRIGRQLDGVRHASSSSSTRWKSRQSRDSFAREAKVAGLKSRAAFKLLEINERYRIFGRGDTVVDLGYAPGSWSQVAVNRTQPGGRVVGIDIIPAQPPRGVSTIQGDFLSPEIREEVMRFVQDPSRGRPRQRAQLSRKADDGGVEEGFTEDELEEESRGLIERERKLDEETAYTVLEAGSKESEGSSQKDVDTAEGRVVDVVLSDMSDPWPQTASSWIRSVSNPYHRMMNTSGMAFRDHAGSMVREITLLYVVYAKLANRLMQDLCNAALTFCYDTLNTGGHFVCKFYQGGEDHAFELKLKKLFEKVHRIKPDSSRKESKEAYFVALRRRAGIARGLIIDDAG